MRIVSLSFYSGQVERGVEVYVKELSNRLSIELISLPAPQYTGSESTLLRRLYLDTTSRAIFQLTRSVLVRLAQHPPDILYPVNNGWQSILCKLFCLQHKTKLLLAGHSGPGWDDRVNLWLHPDAFITFSQAQAKWARGVTKKVPLYVIPHAVDTNQFKPGKSPLRLSLPRPIILCVASGNKNVSATIKAVNRLKKGSLLLIGDGPGAIQVPHSQIQNYYQAADLFTLASSTSEAFGLVYLEALACNKPIVTIDDDLRREIIGPAGVFIKNPSNIDEYSRGLQKAMDTKWGNIPQVQSQKYSWSKITPQYEKLFSSI